MLLATGVLGAASSGYYRERDFYALWSGSRLVASGLDPYDEVVWCRETEGVGVDALTPSGAPRCAYRYAYPLWTAVLLLPLGILSLPWAASLWLSLSIASTIVAIAASWAALRGPPRGVPLLIATVLGSQPFWLTVAGGQPSGVLAAGVALCALATAQTRERRAGLSLAVTALKPSVLALAVLAVVIRSFLRHERAFITGGLFALLSLFAITLPLRPRWPLEWLREVFGRQIGHAGEFATAWGVAAHDLGDLWWGIALIALLLLLCAPAWRRAASSRVALLAIAVPLALFAVPYAWSYDFLVLIFPWSFVLARAERARPLVRRALIACLVLVASPLAWVLYLAAFARGTETLSAFVPALTAVVVAASLRVTDPD